MPTNVSDLFYSVGLEVMGQVNWGERIESNKEGVYIVSISQDPKVITTIEQAPISFERVEKWINAVNTIEIDGKKPTTKNLITRLSDFWISDETILYIGKAGTSLRNRVSQYYRTNLGEKRPHAGGHWIKTLSILNNLCVFWCECSNSEQYEFMLLNNFTNGVSVKTLNNLFDPEKPFPFANLEHPKGNRKNHGIKGSVNK